MTSRRLRAFGAVVRPLARFVMSRAQDPLPMRHGFERMVRYAFRPVPGVTVTSVPASGTAPAGLWIAPPHARPGRVLLYLHGGGYISGSPATHRHLVARLCLMSECAAFVPAYRLAPEFAPADWLDDVEAAHAALIARGFAPHDIVLGGDSAGGGLALVLLARLCQRGLPPAGAFAWSPFCDMTFSGSSVVENGRRDHFFPGDRVHVLTDLLLRGADPADPRLSPLFASFPGCPPVLIQAADCEILRDDAVRMAAHLAAAGADARLDLWPDAPHVWQFFDGWFPEARAAIGATAAFMTSLWPPRSGS